MIDWMSNAGELSEVELTWLLIWNIAAGNWDGIGLPPEKAAEFFSDFVSKLSGDPLVAAQNSRVQLQRGLMACQAPVAEIQREPPFSDRAWSHLEMLLTAWANRGQSGLAQTWEEIFAAPVNWPRGSETATGEQTADRGGLSQDELAWLVAWKAAAGAWDRIDLSPDEAKEVILHFMRCLHKDADALQAAKQSRGRLQQSLMALRRQSFEEIQSEAPFSVEANGNFKELLRAWQDEGEEGVTRVWNRMFAPGRHETKHSQVPIKIIGGPGDCQERALEVIGAPDQETRVAAEWWYLFYTYGRNWQWEMHATLEGNKGAGHFSMHEIRLQSGRGKRIYFRLPW